MPKGPEEGKDIVTVNVEHSSHDHSAIISLASSSSSASSPSSNDSDSESISSSSTKSSASSSKRFKTVTIHKITGSERIELAKEILANHNGSATKYRFHLQTLAENSDEIINIASVDVYKKIVQEYNNRDDISPDWRQNLKTLASTYLSSIETAKKLKGESL